MKLKGRIQMMKCVKLIIIVSQHLHVCMIELQVRVPEEDHTPAVLSSPAQGQGQATTDRRHAGKRN